MQIDEFLQLLKKRRSVRMFKPDPIPNEYVDKILEAGRWAMSGANAQPWEFIVVRKQESKDKLAEAWLECRKESYAIEMTRIEKLRHHQLTRPPSAPDFRNAPVLIVVCGDRRTFQATIAATNFIPGEGGVGGVYIKNVGNATQNMHLAAAALGLGSQWCSVNSLWSLSVRAILDVPGVIDIHTVVAIGYPKYEPSPPYRRELKEIVHLEHYEKSKYRSGEDIVDFLYDLRVRTKQAYNP